MKKIEKISRKTGIKKVEQIAGVLLFVTGITHVLQLYFYGTAGNTLGAASFGVVYFLLGLPLWNLWKPYLLWRLLGSVIPGIGGALGAWRFLVFPNPFSLFHILLDLAIVPICLYALIKGRGETSDR